MRVSGRRPWHSMLFRLGPALGLLQLIAGAALLTSAAAQNVEGTVQIEPALSVVPWERQRFTVFVTVEDLAHAGSITYDDDSDGVPDRETPSVGLGAFELQVGFDPAVLALQTVQPGPGVTGGQRTFQCLQRSEPGVFSFACISAGGNPPGPQGDLTLAALTFGLAGGSASYLTLNAQLAGPLGDSIPVQSDGGGGAVRITGAPQQPTPTAGPGTPRPTQRPDRTATPVQGAQTPVANATTGAGPTATRNPATPRLTPTAPGSPPTGEPTEPEGGPQDAASDPPNGGSDSSSGRSAAQIALLSLGTVAGLSAAGLGAFWFAGRLSRDRHPPPGPWP